jgi:hypothetical protein
MLKHHNLKRAGVYSLDDILPFVITGQIVSNRDRPTRVYGDKLVKMDSLRYQVFATHGVICNSCGIKGSFFALEQTIPLSPNQNPNIWHFNLYAINDDGEEVLMTKDHIKPKSQKGSNRLVNLQPMCYPCNIKKGSL